MEKVDREVTTVCFPTLGFVKLRRCKQADAEHKKSKRQYAHVFHKDKVICVADAFFDLPRKIQHGILGHEAGHLAGAMDEKLADKAGSNIIRMKIKRINSKYGQNLESI